MAQLDVDGIINAIKSVIPDHVGPVSLHEPSLGGNEWAYVKDCLDSTWVSYVGQYVDQFESMLADFTGVKQGGSRGKWYRGAAYGPEIGRGGTRG